MHRLTRNILRVMHFDFPHIWLIFGDFNDINFDLDIHVQILPKLAELAERTGIPRRTVTRALQLICANEALTWSVVSGRKQKLAEAYFKSVHALADHYPADSAKNPTECLKRDGVSNVSALMCCRCQKWMRY